MEIKKICVLGAGLMGNGIAQVCAQAGYDVTLRDIEQRFVDGGMNTIKKNLSRDAEKGKITKEQMDAILGRIKPTLDLKEAAANADVVVEVVIELMDLKKKSLCGARSGCSFTLPVFHQHLRSQHYGNGRDYQAAGAFYRHPFFQSRSGDAPFRSHPRPADLG